MKLISDEASNHLSSNGMSAWVESLDDLVQEALTATSSTVIRPIYGGLFGSVILVQTGEMRRVLKLFPKEKATRGQIDALLGMRGNGCPKVYAADKDRGWVLLEEIANKVPLNQPVDLGQAYRAVSQIWSSPLENYHLSYLDLFDFWLEIHGQDSPADLLTGISKARHLIEQAPAGELTHIHADIGVHNLMRRDSGELVFVDPSGALGPATVDLGALAAWSGAPRSKSISRAIDLAGIAGIGPVEPCRWALVCTIADANMLYSGGNTEQSRECMIAAEILLQQFKEIQR